MAINPDFRLKVRHFIRDHYKPVLIVLAVFLVLAMINRFLMGRDYTGKPITTFNPNVPILDSTSSVASVPKEVSNEFENFIDKYVGYCNNRNYVAAWNMVSEDCKKNFYGNNYDLFVKYVQQKFDGNTKRYAIQNYSNVDGQYIYNVKIFNDFLATGLTNQTYTYQEEKFSISYDKDKNLVCSVGNYMGSNKLNYMASNDYLRVEVTNEIDKYSFIMYQVNFINRTNHIIVIQDGLTDSWEIGMAIGNEVRPNVDDVQIVLQPGESKELILSFDKFYDSVAEPDGIVFNAVRVMDNYTGNVETAEAEIENAIDKFSMTIAF
ncbi:MAG: hypothetical protein IJ629_04245 [Clostridia bacterium]|nr:hypothetical protein [Clostridia bacterium]